MPNGNGPDRAGTFLEGDYGIPDGVAAPKDDKTWPGNIDTRWKGYAAGYRTYRILKRESVPGHPVFSMRSKVLLIMPRLIRSVYRTRPERIGMTQLHRIEGILSLVCPIICSSRRSFSPRRGLNRQ